MMGHTLHQISSVTHNELSLFPWFDSIYVLGAVSGLTPPLSRLFILQ